MQVISWNAASYCHLEGKNLCQADLHREKLDLNTRDGEIKCRQHPVIWSLKLIPTYATKLKHSQFPPRSYKGLQREHSEMEGLVQRTCCIPWSNHLSPQICPPSSQTTWTNSAEAMRSGLGKVRDAAGVHSLCTAQKGRGGQPRGQPWGEQNKFLSLGELRVCEVETCNWDERSNRLFTGVGGRRGKIVNRAAQCFFGVFCCSSISPCSLPCHCPLTASCKPQGTSPSLLCTATPAEVSEWQKLNSSTFGLSQHHRL